MGIDSLKNVEKSVDNVDNTLVVLVYITIKYASKMHSFCRAMGVQILKKKLFIKNALILTATALVLRFAGIFFKVWLAGKVGAEGIGLYQLVFSFYALVSTFAACGISTAVTRLVTDELVLGSRRSVEKIVLRAVALSLSVAFLTFFGVYFGADFISGTLIGDMRAAKALKILAFSLPFMGISSCLKGYFIARRATLPPSISQIIEQVTRISVCIALLLRYSTSVEDAAAAVLFGDTVAEAVSFLFVFVSYRLDIKKNTPLAGRVSPPFSVAKKIAAISLPIAGGRYLNSALRTAENVLVPKALTRSALDSSASLAVFGNIKGMALPILLFPSSLLNSVSMLLIPEMSEYAAVGDKKGIAGTTARTLSLTFSFSAIITAVFCLYGGQIGEIIYKDNSVGRIIMLLSPLVPVMYLDSVADGILKGLDEQLITFRNSILDSSLRIILVMLLLPYYGENGFIGIMYFSNFLTCIMNVARLFKVTKCRIDFVGSVVFPTLAAAFSALVARILAKTAKGGGEIIETAIFCLAAVGIYGIIMVLKEGKNAVFGRQKTTGGDDCTRGADNLAVGL